ncbi:hypothetical protein [Streptomyces lavendulae]|uniref:hypothetical protein n=1 Tax=Streptomyces lavendulae TaxID=1914 RepID=UPI0036955503
MQGPLADRIGSVRLKYRSEALRLAQNYWSADFTALISDTLSTLEAFTQLLETEERLPGKFWPR